MAKAVPVGYDRVDINKLFYVKALRDIYLWQRLTL